MRVLVTGGSGFIGGAIVKKMLQTVDRNDLYVYDIVPPATDVKFIDAVSVPLSQLNPFDLVFHCAGLLGTQVLFERTLDAVDVNIIGTLNVLELQKDKGIVYCAGLVDKWDNTYMITKDTAERFAVMYRRWYKTKVAVVRMPHVYGPGQSTHQEKAIPTFIKQALAGEPLTINGSGQHRMQLLYVDDAAEVFVRLAGRGITKPTLMDATSLQRTNSLSVLEVARLIIAMTKSKSELELVPMRRGQEESVTHTPMDMHQTIKLFNELGIEETSLVDGMAESIYYYRKFPDAV